MNNLFEGIFEQGLFQNKETLDEILLRLMLLLELGEKKIVGTNKISITVDVRDTIFPFTDLLKPEAFHVFYLSLNLNRNALSCHLQIIENEELTVARSLNSVKPYFSLIYSWDNKCSKLIKCEIRDSIIGWKDYFKSAFSISCCPDRYVTNINLSVKPIIELNRNTVFIKRSDLFLEELESELREDVNKSFMRQFGIQYDQILPFIDIIKKNNPSEIRNFLEANFPDNLLKLDLILCIIDFPDLEFVDLEEYEMRFDKKLIAKMLKLSKEDMLTLMAKFKEMANNVENFDLNSDYDANKLLRNVLSESN